MFSITCSRCGKPIMSSVPEALCQGCKRRWANGKRLAAENRERRAEEAALEVEEREWALREDKRLDTIINGGDW